MELAFDEICESYLSYVKLKLKPQSIRGVTSRITTYILPYFKKYTIDEITPMIYLKWQAEIEGKNFSYKYKKALHYTMVAIFNFYINFQDDSQRNIPSLVGNFKNNEVAQEMQIFSVEEYQDFISCVCEIIYRVLFRFFFVSGARVGESLALNFLDLEGNVIIINKTISKEYYNGKRVITTPKTKNSIRKIILDDTTVKQINELKEYYRLKFGYFNDNFYIFGGVSPLSPTTVERKKNYYCKLAGVKQIKLHGFRHSNASYLLSQGIPITTIAKRLGHSDISMTLNVYSHAIPSDEKRVVNLLNSLC